MLVLCSVLRVAQTLRLLALLAATGGAAVAAGAIPTTLKGRDRVKDSKNLSAYISNQLGFESNMLKHQGKYLIHL